MSAGDTITIRLADISGALSPQLELFDGSGSQIATTFDFTGGTATLTETLSGSSPYTVLASDREDDSTGTYTLFFQRVSDPCSATPASCGQTSTSTLAAAAEYDSYELVGVGEGDRVTVRMSDTSGAVSPWLELFDGSGSQIATTFDFTGGTATLTETLSGPGPYTVLASDREDDSTGTYSLFFQRVSDPCSATSVSCGQTSTSALAAAAEYDSYELVGVGEGDRVTVRMSDTSDAVSPKLELFDGSGSQIASTFDFAGGTATLTETLSGPGPYTVLASDREDDSTGTYSLFFQRVSDPCSATSVSCGQTNTKALAAAAEVHSYELVGVGQGDRVTVRMSDTSGSVSPRLELFDGSGSQIASTFDFAGGTATLTETLTAPSPYTVLASDREDDSTGTYSLFFQRVSDPCSATSVSCGQTSTSALAVEAEYDSYELFGIGQGDRVTVRMSDTSGSVSPRLELFDGSGSQIASTFDFAGGTATLTETLSGPGPYTVLASDREDDSTGTYSLFFQRVSDPCSATSVSCGQTNTKALAAAAEVHSYELVGVGQGDRVTVRMSDTSGAVSPRLELFDGSGSQIASTFDFAGGTATMTETLTAPGPYTVLASDREDDSTGAYSLFFQRVSDPCSAMSLPCGQTSTSALAAAAEVHSYELAGVGQGDRVTVRMSDTSGAVSPRLELFDGSGSQIASTFDFAGGTAAMTETLTAPGPYTVLASDREYNSTGAYSLFFQRVSDPCSATQLSLGQEALASITPVAEIDTYVLSGVEQNDAFTLCMRGSSPLAPSLELYDGAGTLLGTDTGFTGGTAAVTETLSSGGPVAALASERSHDDTGDYTLALRGANSSCATTDSAPPTVTTVSPVPGDLVASGSPVLVQWSSADDVGVTSHTVRLSTDGGATFPTVIASGLSGAAQTYLWAVPGTLHSDRARLRIVARDATGAVGAADTGGDFLIVDDPPTRTISYTYDQLNRLTGVEYSDGSTIEYVYDAVGNRETMTSTGPVVIHADGFESGDTSGWTASTGSVAVSAAAALTGSFGLRVDVGCPGDGELVVPDGTVGTGVYEGCRSVRAGAVRVDPGPVTFRAGRRVQLGDGFSVAQGAAFRVEIAPGLVPDAFVSDDSPTAEARYGASFSLRLDGLALEPGDEIELLAGSSSDGTTWFRLLLEPEPGSGDHLLVLEARQDDGTLRTTAGQPVSVTTGWHTVELHWRAAETAVDGRFDLVLDDTPRARLTGVDNAAGRIDSVRLGASGADADSTGLIDLDEFTSQPQL